MVTPTATKAACRRPGKAIRWRVISTQPHMTAPAIMNRHNSETSGATTPSCMRKAIQLNPHEPTTAA